MLSGGTKSLLRGRDTFARSATSVGGVVALLLCGCGQPWNSQSPDKARGAAANHPACSLTDDELAIIEGLPETLQDWSFNNNANKERILTGDYKDHECTLTKSEWVKLLRVECLFLQLEKLEDDEHNRAERARWSQHVKTQQFLMNTLQDSCEAAPDNGEPCMDWSGINDFAESLSDDEKEAFKTEWATTIPMPDGNIDMIRYIYSLTNNATKDDYTDVVAGIAADIEFYQEKLNRVGELNPEDIKEYCSYDVGEGLKELINPVVDPHFSSIEGNGEVDEDEDDEDEDTVDEPSCAHGSWGACCVSESWIPQDLTAFCSNQCFGKFTSFGTANPCGSDQGTSGSEPADPDPAVSYCRFPNQSCEYRTSPGCRNYPEYSEDWLERRFGPNCKVSASCHKPRCEYNPSGWL